MWACVPAVELALWQYVLDLDLVDRVRAEQRPPDDPLRMALADQRGFISKGRFDEQWVRLLHVDAALGARSYNPARPAVTVAVSDPLFDRNTGTWRTVMGRAWSVRPTPADLTTTINGISGAGTSWHRWAAERQQALADVLLAHDVAQVWTFY
jgi:predicted acetyltransferase